MTYNYKAYLFRKVFAICALITTAIFSTQCQKDDDFKDTEQNIDFTPVKSFNTISLHTFKKNEKALKAFSSLTKRFKKKNNINRFSTDSIANLILNTESIKYLENTSTNYHSYTFAVSNTPIGSGLQNVMLSLQPDGSYKEFLLHYDITEAEIITLQHGGYVDYGNRLHIEALEDGTFSDVLNKTYYEDGCWYKETYYPDRCCSGQHYYGDGETCYEEGECKPQASGGRTTTTVLSCTSGGNGGGNNNNPDEPNVGSTGNGDESSVNTCRRNCIEPDDEEEDSDEEEEECQQLEEIMSNSDLATPLIAMNNAVTDSNKEKGYILFANNTEEPYYDPILLQDPDFRQITVPPNKRIFIVLHSHPKAEGVQMFGAGDVHVLYRLATTYDGSIFDTNGNGQHDVGEGPDISQQTFTVYMVVEMNTYALKIRDFSKLAEIGSIYNDADKQLIFEENLFNAYGDINNEVETATQDELAEVFLKEMQDFGVSVYKKNTTDILQDLNNTN